MDLHFAAVWESVADTVPDVDAIVVGERRYTYREFDDTAARFAAGLAAAGVPRGANVSLYLYNCAEYLLAQHGTFKHGGAAINVNYRYLDDELAYLVDNSDSEVLVYHRSLADRVDRVRGKLDRVRLFIEVDDGEGSALVGVADWDRLVADHEPAARVDHDPTDLYLLYTGGTTGMPKGVMYESGTLTAGLYAAVAAAQPWGLAAPTAVADVPGFVRAIRDTDTGPLRSVPCAPLMHGTGMWVGAMPALLTGGTVILLQNRHFDPDELWRVVERERPTRLAIVGDAFARPMLRSLDAASEAGSLPDLSSLQSINSSGAMWSAEVKDGLHRYLSATLNDGLGSSEGGGYGAKPSSDTGDGSTARFALAPGTRLVDELHEPIETVPGAHGLLATLSGSKGYFKDPEKTARTFTTIDDKWYVVTGDWATVDDDGLITLHGRGSNCINTGGEKVFPEEVEEAVKRHPAVDDCLVVGVPDERFGSRIVAVAGSDPGTHPTEDDVRRFVRDQLAGYKVPKQVVFVDVVQRAPNGKADYGWAREVALAAT